MWGKESVSEQKFVRISIRQYTRFYSRYNLITNKLDVAIPLAVGVWIDDGAAIAYGFQSLVALVHIVAVARVMVAKAKGDDAGVVA